MWPERNKIKTNLNLSIYDHLVVRLWLLDGSPSRIDRNERSRADRRPVDLEFGRSSGDTAKRSFVLGPAGSLEPRVSACGRGRESRLGADPLRDPVMKPMRVTKSDPAESGFFV